MSAPEASAILPESPRRFTTAELAKRFRLSEQRLRARRLAGLPPRFMKIGARVLYDERDVLAYEAGRTFGSTTEVRPEGVESLP